MNTYSSIFKDEILGFLDLRASQGQKGKDRRVLFTLDVFLSGIGSDEKSITPGHVDGWLCSLSGKINANTKIVYVSHYSQFAKYLYTLGIPAFIPEKPVGENTYMPYIFSKDEMERLFEAADRYSGTNGMRPPNNPLHFPVVLRILYGCGLRHSEVLALTVADVDLDNGTLLIRKGKGDKDRLVPMDDSLTEILRIYLEVIGKDLSDGRLLFESRNRKKYSPDWTKYCFRTTLKQAGIELLSLPRHSRNICVHCLRHTFAVDSFRKQDIAGIDSYASAPLLSVYMGHAKLTDTQIYLHMTAQNSKDIIEKMDAYTAGIFPEVPI